MTSCIDNSIASPQGREIYAKRAWAAMGPDFAHMGPQRVAEWCGSDEGPPSLLERRSLAQFFNVSIPDVYLLHPSEVDRARIILAVESELLRPKEDRSLHRVLGAHDSDADEGDFR